MKLVLFFLLLSTQVMAQVFTPYNGETKIVGGKISSSAGELYLNCIESLNDHCSKAQFLAKKENAFFSVNPELTLNLDDQYETAWYIQVIADLGSTARPPYPFTYFIFNSIVVKKKIIKGLHFMKEENSDHNEELSKPNFLALIKVLNTFDQ